MSGSLLVMLMRLDSLSLEGRVGRARRGRGARGSLHERAIRGLREGTALEFPPPSARRVGGAQSSSELITMTGRGVSRR